MAQVMAELNVPVILMHNRKNREYNRFIEDVLTDCQESIDLVKRAGLGNDKIILDPGIGFAKNYEHNMELMCKLDGLCNLIIRFSWLLPVKHSSANFLIYLLENS